MASPWRDPRNGIFHLRKRPPIQYVAIAGPGALRTIGFETAARQEAEKARARRHRRMTGKLEDRRRIAPRTKRRAHAFCGAITFRLNR